MANTRITEKKLIHIKRPECRRPIHLAWLNSLGGVTQWVFEGNRRIDEIDSDHRTFERPYENLETTEFIVGSVSKNRSSRLVLQADNLTEDWYNGIMDIISSIKILMLTNPESWETEGTKWIEVFIAPGTHSTQTIANLKSLTLTVVLQPVLTTRR